MRYASGKNALARCARCGDKRPYDDIVKDGQTLSWVCNSCRDEKHPSERPFRNNEGIQLHHPSPDVDDDSPGENQDTVAEALFPNENNFGGIT